MLLSAYALALCALSITTASAYRSNSQAPECVSKCWSNSQYVSSCMGDTKCLCDDADFQNAVYQCLYSQCSTSKFGVALHHALGYCAGHSSQPTSSALLAAASPLPTSIQQPALLKQEGVQRRATGAMMSNSVTRSVTRTKPTQSVPGSVYMAYNTQRAIVKTLTSEAAAEPTPLFGASEIVDGQLVNAQTFDDKPRPANGNIKHDRHHRHHGQKVDDL